jgi:hypothetical protein
MPPPTEAISLDHLLHDPEIATALGYMVVAWAQADEALIMAFSAISGMDLNMAAVAYYRIPTFEARTKVIRALIEGWPNEKLDLPAIDKAIQKLSKLARARNDWVHGCWAHDQERNCTYVFDFRVPVGDKSRRKLISAHDVLNHIDAVQHRTLDLNDLMPCYEELLTRSP